MAEEYLILIVEPEWDPATVTEQEWTEAMRAHGAFIAAVTEAGAEMLAGDPLQPPRAAVRIVPGHDGKPPIFTDGPFAETKEVISGFYKIGVKDAAQARDLAALCPTGGWIELWPVLKIPA